jgi:hypothetical protein
MTIGSSPMQWASPTTDMNIRIANGHLLERPDVGHLAVASTNGEAVHHLSFNTIK